MPNVRLLTSSYGHLLTLIEVILFAIYFVLLANIIVTVSCYNLGFKTRTIFYFTLVLHFIKYLVMYFEFELKKFDLLWHLHEIWRRVHWVFTDLNGFQIFSSGVKKFFSSMWNWIQCLISSIGIASMVAYIYREIEDRIVLRNLVAASDGKSEAFSTSFTASLSIIYSLLT